MSIWNPTIGLMTIPYWKKNRTLAAQVLFVAPWSMQRDTLHTRVLWWGCLGWKIAVEVGGLEPGHGCFVYIYISTSLYTQLDMYIRIFIIYISYIYIHIWQLYNINVHFIFCLSCNIYIYINRYIHIHYMNFMIACQISTTLVPLTM